MMTTTINMMMINNQNLNIYEDDQIDNANDVGLSPEGPWHAALCQGTAENETNFQNCHQDRDYGGNGQMKLGHFMEFKSNKNGPHNNLFVYFCTNEISPYCANTSETDPSPSLFLFRECP